MMALGSSAEVDASGRLIVLRPALADVLVCRRIPGGQWDSARKAWTYPATVQTAGMIRRNIKQLAESDQFRLLLTTSGTAPAGETISIGGITLPSSTIYGKPGACHPDAQPGPEAPCAALVVEPGSVIRGGSMMEAVQKHFRITAPAQVVQNAQKLLAPEPDILIDLPAGIRSSPWRHQRAAFQFCLDHFAQGMRGLLLACGMGTGKSLIAIMLMLFLKAKRIMVACPLRVVPVWLTQIERHSDADMVVVALDESAGRVTDKLDLAIQKMRLAEARGVPFIVVVNYDSAWRDPFAAWADRLRWDLVILDEAHRIKQPSGKASKFFFRMRKMAAYRIALTGTPMPHGPMDVFALVRALDISLFGPSFSAFRQKFARMGGYQNKQIVEYLHLEELEDLLGRITYRVGKEVLDLPPETDVTYYCELGREARRAYQDVERDFVAEVEAGTMTVANAMVKVLRLEQIACGIFKTDAGVEHRIDESKMKLLADVLEDIGPEEPVVVFCWFHQDLEAVHLAARSLGYTTRELSGRRDELQQWQDGQAQVLAVQIQAGGEGVDLTRARHSIFFSVGYSLGKYMQARSRTHRPGQVNPVEHIHLIARNTVDVRIMRALEKRAEIVESILAEIKN